MSWRTNLAGEDNHAVVATPEKLSRRPSFAFLRRTTSRDLPTTSTDTRTQRGSSSGSGTRLTKQEPKQEAVARREYVSRLPSYHALPAITNPFSPLPSPSFVTYIPEDIVPHFPPSEALGRVNSDPVIYDTLSIMEKQKSSIHNAPVSSAPLSLAIPLKVHTSDPYPRTESMTNRGRYNYFSSSMGDVDSARRIRRKKDPTPFNILVIGTKGSGKTSFIDFLQKSLARPSKLRSNVPASPPSASKRHDGHPTFTPSYVDIDHDGEKLGVTLFDSKGLEKHIVDLQIRELTAFVESKFQETFSEEQKLSRATGAKDTHIHCVLLFLDPTRLDANIDLSFPQSSGGHHGIHVPHTRTIGCLDEELDIAVLRALQDKTTVIPIISKADTMTVAHMAYLKRNMAETFKTINFDPIEPLDLESDTESEYDDAQSIVGKGRDDEVASTSGDGNVGKSYLANGQSENIQETEVNNLTEGPVKNGIEPTKTADSATSLLPLSVISPDNHEPEIIGRRFAWGVADPYNPAHCDFNRMKELIFNEWEIELRATSRVLFYEGWRTTRLKKRGSPSSIVRHVSSATAKGPASTVARSVSGSIHGGSRVLSNSSNVLAIDTPPASPEPNHETVGVH